MAEVNYNKPFCFRCGQTPQYMIKLEERLLFDGELRGPFWIMCKSCIFELDWNDVFKRTLTVMDTPEELDETKGLEESNE